MNQTKRGYLCHPNLLVYERLKFQIQVSFLNPVPSRISVQEWHKGEVKMSILPFGFREVKFILSYLDLSK